MSKNYYQLNIDISNSVNQQFDLNVLLGSSEFLQKNHWCQWFFGGEELCELFNILWLEYMKDIGLDIQHAYVFYREPWLYDNTPHVDTEKTNTLSHTINWVITPDDSKMVWFKFKNSINGEVVKSPTGKQYTRWNRGDLIETDSHIIGNVPTLVRVDVPHTIDMQKNPRCCISIRTKEKVLSWEQTVSSLQQFIIK